MHVPLLLDRARREVARGRVHLALALLRRAVDAAEAGPERLAVRHALLDACEDHLEKDAPETEEAARALLADTGGADARGHALLGTALSFRARRAWDGDDGPAGQALAREAEAALEAAVARLPEDSDAWGTLGGLRKRMADRARREGDGDRARALDAAMLDAYRRGGLAAPDAYPLLNFLEERARVDPGPLLRAGEAALAERLQRALHQRRLQVARGQERPWAAFDLARGQHYLEPNVPRFLHDLERAVEDARAVARAPGDRWTVETVARSLDALEDPRVGLDGVVEARELLARAVVDDRWLAGHWGPLGRPPEFLADELREARGEVAAALARREAAGLDEATLAPLRAFLAREEARWTEAEEARFQAEAAALGRSFEPRYKKALRVAWRLLGRRALDRAGELAGLPELGGLPELLARLLGERVDAALGPDRRAAPGGDP